jgi:dolichol-phosphate mannosyltransferase
LQTLSDITYPAQERVEVSVVIPAFNEARNIDAAVRLTLKALQETAETYEVVVVDDGSVDDTFEKMKLLSNEFRRVKLVRNLRNLGKGMAVKNAAKIVNGDSVLVMDADLEIPPEQVQRYVQTLKKYDVCVASKWHPESVYKAPLTRKILSLTFNKIVQIMTGIRLADSQSGMKGIKGAHFKRIMNVISVKRYAYDVEILAVARLMNLKVGELPIRIEQDAGFSKKAVMYMMIDLLGIAYRLRILKWYQQNVSTVRVEYKPILRI